MVKVSPAGIYVNSVPFIRGWSNSGGVVLIVRPKTICILEFRHYSRFVPMWLCDLFELCPHKGTCLSGRRRHCLEREPVELTKSIMTKGHCLW